MHYIHLSWRYATMHRAIQLSEMRRLPRVQIFRMGAINGSTVMSVKFSESQTMRFDSDKAFRHFFERRESIEKSP